MDPKDVPGYNQPAFPVSRVHRDDEDVNGMKLRDYFAAHANEDDIAEYHVYGSNGNRVTREEARYAFADAMLKVRKS